MMRIVRPDGVVSVPLTGVPGVKVVAAQGLHELARRDGADVALALERLFIRIHRVGNIDRKHDFDVDRDGARV